MSVADAFLRANARYAATYTNTVLPAAPACKVAILTCMDARLDPATFLGLHDGDAHVIRNAGGRAPDAIRSLVISQHLLGTREIVVIHHTECGMQTATDTQVQQQVHATLHVTAAIPFLMFTDLEESVRADVTLIRQSPLLFPDTRVRGFIYDVRDGRLREVR